MPIVHVEQLKGDFMQTDPFSQVLHGLASRGFAVTNTIPSPALNPDHRLAVISRNDQKRLIVVVPLGQNEGTIRPIANWEKVEYYILQKEQHAGCTDFIFVSEADEFPIQWGPLDAEAI